MRKLFAVLVLGFVALIGSAQAGAFVPCTGMNEQECTLIHGLKAKQWALEQDGKSVTLSSQEGVVVIQRGPQTPASVVFKKEKKTPGWKISSEDGKYVYHLKLNVQPETVDLALELFKSNVVR